MSERKNDKNKKDKVDLSYNLKIDELDKTKENYEGYDFVPKDHHWTNISEQKVKVEEIEEKTK